MLRDWTASDRVELLSAGAEVFFTRLIMKADDYGLYYGNPKLLKSHLFPLKRIPDSRVAGWISECQAAGVIELYRAEDREYIHILNFGQRLRSKSAKFPRPQNSEVPQRVDSPPTSVRKPPPEEREKRREVEIEDEGEEREKVLSLSEFEKCLDERFMDVLEHNHKGKDIPRAIREAYTHLVANPARARRADASAVKNLVNTWLSNMRMENNKGNSSQSAEQRRLRDAEKFT